MSAEPAINPYAPPTSSIDPPTALGDPYADLASRWRRLGGSLLDAVFQSLMAIPAYLSISWSAVVQAQQVDPDPLIIYKMSGTAGIVAAALGLAMYIVQWTLIARRGQSLGKILVGTRIVMLDGSHAPFVRSVALRSWPVFLAAFIPVIGPWLTTLDVLFIFRKDKRCLHDLLAGTKVVRVPETT